jgi:hypothetical protein
MPGTDNIVIDKENMQIDRSTPLGQAFERMADEAAAQKNPAMSKLMSNVVAYAEAATVVDETVGDPAKKDQMLGKLKAKMESV